MNNNYKYYNPESKTADSGFPKFNSSVETKDNIVTAIKNRTKEIRDYTYDNESTKLIKLMPLLLDM